MAEHGKIEKPHAEDFKEKRKLYVVPMLPFEELALQFKIDTAAVERLWGEVRDKIEYFVSMYGDIKFLYIEGITAEENAGIEYFERFGKDSNHYKLMKNLIDKGAVIKGIDKGEYVKRSRLLFEEYSRSFLPETKETHEGFYGKDIDFEGWRNYLVKKILETQEEMNRLASRILGEMPENANGVLIITDGRAVEFPEGMDVFQIRPPAFDEISRNLREQSK